MMRACGPHSRLPRASPDRLVEHAWPVLRGAAEWIASRVVETGRGYEIRRAGGVAETGRPVDNAAFVNMQAIRTLQAAMGLGERLKREYPAQWDAIAKALVVPHDDELGIIVNHDGYQPDEDKGATPDAPAGLFPGDFEADAETERKTFQYFLALADRYAGVPMLSAMLGVYAARVGDRARSLELFEKGYAAFIRDPFSITLEMDPAVYPDQPRAGPFTANLGGFLTACIYGLTGIQLGPGTPSSWCRRLVTMPQGWDGIHVERLWVRGHPASLDAEHGDDRARLVVHDTTKE